jgi:hypothetical protein
VLGRIVRLVFYAIYTKIERNALQWDIQVDFSYLIPVFCVGGITLLISFEKTPIGKLWTTHFLLASSSRGVMGASVRLLWESRHARLMQVANRWFRSPLSVRAVPVASGS